MSRTAAYQPSRAGSRCTPSRCWAAASAGSGGRMCARCRRAGRAGRAGHGLRAPGAPSGAYGFTGGGRPRSLPPAAAPTPGGASPCVRPARTPTWCTRTGCAPGCWPRWRSRPAARSRSSSPGTPRRVPDRRAARAPRSAAAARSGGWRAPRPSSSAPPPTGRPGPPPRARATPGSRRSRVPAPRRPRRPRRRRRRPPQGARRTRRGRSRPLLHRRRPPGRRHGLRHAAGRRPRLARASTRRRCSRSRGRGRDRAVLQRRIEREELPGAAARPPGRRAASCWPPPMSRCCPAAGRPARCSPRRRCTRGCRWSPRRSAACPNWSATRPNWSRTATPTPSPTP